MNIKYEIVRDEIRKASLFLKEVYPDVACINIHVFKSWVGGIRKENSYKITPDDKLFLWVDCPNPDCTGTGFDLRFQIYESCRKRKILVGNVWCNGRESNEEKFYECCSRIVYMVECEFLDDNYPICESERNEALEKFNRLKEEL